MRGDGGVTLFQGAKTHRGVVECDQPKGWEGKDEIGEPFRGCWPPPASSEGLCRTQEQWGGLWAWLNVHLYAQHDQREVFPHTNRAVWGICDENRKKEGISGNPPRNKAQRGKAQAVVKKFQPCQLLLPGWPWWDTEAWPAAGCNWWYAQPSISPSLLATQGCGAGGEHRPHIAKDISWQMPFSCCYNLLPWARAQSCERCPMWTLRSMGLLPGRWPLAGASHLHVGALGWGQVSSWEPFYYGFTMTEASPRSSPEPLVLLWRRSPLALSKKSSSVLLKALAGSGLALGFFVKRWQRLRLLGERKVLLT